MSFSVVLACGDIDVQQPLDGGIAVDGFQTNAFGPYTLTISHLQ